MVSDSWRKAFYPLMGEMLILLDERRGPYDVRVQDDSERGLSRHGFFPRDLLLLIGRESSPKPEIL